MRPSYFGLLLVRPETSLGLHPNLEGSARKPETFPCSIILNLPLLAPTSQSQARPESQAGFKYLGLQGAPSESLAPFNGGRDAVRLAVWNGVRVSQGEGCTFWFTAAP